VAQRTGVILEISAAIGYGMFSAEPGSCRGDRAGRRHRRGLLPRSNRAVRPASPGTISTVMRGADRQGLQFLLTNLRDFFQAAA
jgi:hypothetical protein